MVTRHYPEALERLQAKLVELRLDLAKATDSANPVQLDQSTQGRLSRMDAMQQQEMASNHVQRLRQEERKLQAAIDRVLAGSYGLCCNCGDEINEKRLSLDPGAPFCSECVNNA